MSRRPRAGYPRVRENRGAVEDCRDETRPCPSSRQFVIFVAAEIRLFERATTIVRVVCGYAGRNPVVTKIGRDRRFGRRKSLAIGP